MFAKFTSNTCLHGTDFILISARSKEFKGQYEELQRKVIEAGDLTQVTYEKKRGYILEKKEAMLERNEALKYEQLREDLVK